MISIKIAIIGAGLSGLSCALELEKNGIIADVFERDNNTGWAWSEIGYWPNVIYGNLGDTRDYLKKNYNIDIRPTTKCRTNIIKSPNKQVNIQGDLGYFIPRGKGNESIESQLKLQFRKIAIQYNTPADYKELSQKYDWVIISTGTEKEAIDLNVWQQHGTIRVIQGVVMGNFDPDAATMYLNTKYAGTGFGRITPFNSVQSILSLYVIGLNGSDLEGLFDYFIKLEKLDNLEILYKTILPNFNVGKVKKFKINNVLLTGKAAGLTESFIGTGGIEAIVSGVLAAKSIIYNKDYDLLMKPLQKHIDNISSLRNTINNYTNDDFDKLMSFLDTPGIKQIIYNSQIGFADIIGGVLKKFKV